MRVEDELTAAAWHVETAALPSVAEKGGPRLGLHDDANAIRLQIDRITGPVVIVTHSYRGQWFRKRLRTW
jgi:hypothetical protein